MYKTIDDVTWSIEFPCYNSTNALGDSYLAHANGFVFLAPANDTNSLDFIQSVIVNIEHARKCSVKKVPRVFVITKCDMSQPHALTAEQKNVFASMYDLEMVETVPS